MVTIKTTQLPMHPKFVQNVVQIARYVRTINPVLNVIKDILLTPMINVKHVWKIVNNVKMELFVRNVMISIRGMRQVGNVNKGFHSVNLDNIIIRSKKNVFYVHLPWNGVKNAK